jgi:hypothetical protein
VRISFNGKKIENLCNLPEESSKGLKYLFQKIYFPAESVETA